jgi:Kae1-associated kinase Bud32
MERLGDGAEAVIYKDDDRVIKERVRKSYRIPEIDERLRKLRTRKEGKLLEKLSRMGIAPKPLKIDDVKMQIQMEFLPGKKVRDILNRANCVAICREIGKKVAELHNAGIIHSDLTTSNMIYHCDKIYIIDFGLGYESAKIEDKAVDIHLFRQALESKHHQVFKTAFGEFLKSYKAHAPDAAQVMVRFEAVERRGRNKLKGG